MHASSNRHHAIRSLYLALCLSLLLLPLAAAAEDRPGEADKLLEEGVIQYGLADFESSVEKLNLALQGAKRPEILAKIQLFLGANFMDMGQQKKARQAFLAALKHNPMLKLPEEFKSSQKEAFEAVRKEARGTLRISSNTRARIKVGGKAVGHTPYQAKLPIGSHVVAVQGPSGRWRTETVILFPSRETRIRANFKLARKAPAPRTRRDGGGGRLWTWIAAGTAAAVAGVGLGLWFSADPDHQEWRDLQPDAATAVSNDAQLTELEDSIRAKELGAYISFGVAGAVAITSVVLFFVEGRSARAERRTAGLELGPLELTPVLGMHSGLSLSASF